jgi:hypothetical protein
MAIGIEAAECAGVLRLRHTAPSPNQIHWPYPTNPALTVGPNPFICSGMTDDDFQLQVEAFIDRHGMSPTTFGLWAMDDSRFVFDLRKGRNCMLTTVKRVHRFMAEYDQKQMAKMQRRALADAGSV